jgi:hypothetical protein
MIIVQQRSSLGRIVRRNFIWNPESKKSIKIGLGKK